MVGEVRTKPKFHDISDIYKLTDIQKSIRKFSINWLWKYFLTIFGLVHQDFIMGYPVMAGRKTIFSMIRTKLDRPPIDRNHVHRPHQLERLGDLIIRHRSEDPI